MKRVAKKLALGIVGALGLAVVAAATYLLWPESAGGGHGIAAGTPDPAQVTRGRYLARAGDCMACHTERGSAAYAGGRPIPTPFGTIYTPNITPDPETGIGNWSAEDFWQAMHEGRAPGGRLLYPAFPYTSYTRVSRADVDAIYAYLRSLDPVRKPPRAPELAFPYNVRRLLAAWRALYFDAGVFRTDPKRDAQWNRGAYLVQGLGHCNDCHTVRNALGAVVRDRHLRGGMIPVQDWYAPDLGADAGGGLAGWSEQDIVDLLGTGRSARGVAYGPMAEVVEQSLQYLRPDDLRAIAAYLRDLPRNRGEEGTVGIRPPAGQHANLLTEGRGLYVRHCKACHQDDGTGVAGVYPALDGNTSVLSPNPVDPVRIVLLGGFEPVAAGHLRPYSMPPFAQELSDRDVAAVVSYIRGAWHNRAGSVSPQTVREYRSTPTR